MIRVKLRVTLEYSGYLYNRDGDWTYYPTQNVDMSHTGGFVTYPDRNVKTFTVIVHSGIGSLYPEYYYKEYKSIQQEKANMSYAFVGQVDSSYLSWRHWDASPDDIAQENYFDQNRIAVSQTISPFYFKAGNVLYVGNSSNDPVMAVAANAAPVSTGQYGEHPLYVFCKDSIWALAVGDGSTIFSRVIPFSIGRGLIAEKAVTQVGGQIVYASEDGIQTIPEAAQRMSDVIEPDILSLLDEDTELHYYRDVTTARREIWLVTNSGTYCFSLDHGRWFTITPYNTTIKYFESAGKLFGFVAYYLMSTETNLSSPNVGRFETAPINFSEPDVLKRVRRLLMRTTMSNGQTDVDTAYQVQVQQTSGYEFTVKNDSVSGDIKGFDAEYEFRYTHRPRIRRTEKTVSGWLGYGYGYGNHYGYGL